MPKGMTNFFTLVLSAQQQIDKGFQDEIGICTPARHSCFKSSSSYHTHTHTYFL